MASLARRLWGKIVGSREQLQRTVAMMHANDPDVFDKPEVSFTPTLLPVVQKFAGAQDLDIKPADNTQCVTVGRIWA